MRTACGITLSRDICSKRNTVVKSAWPYLLSSCAWSAHARVHGNNCSFVCLECAQELGSAEKRGRHLLIYYADRCHTPAWICPVRLKCYNDRTGWFWCTVKLSYC
ncbi:hypothetical protein T07_8075 [Trichinella nelsoni]|uniref:C2H2-type domain-containing protein n=1 Tax=Trichinella nelsoni TaxID=6336 RepID=A0A0V0SH00_9BILA|nr:hypothetical protein T07_8075 [Trichinella nelsoni]